MNGNKIKKFVWINYLVFWFLVLGLCGTASMVFHAPPVIMRVLSNVCAWSPTFVLLAGHRYWLGEKSVAAFYNETFSGSIHPLILFLSAAVTIIATLVSVFITGVIQGRAFSEFWSLGAWPFWASFLFSITSGPTGEESGWRGYLRPLLNERHGYVISCIIQGVIWAFWHTVLWFVDSDFMGLQMIPYVISNVIVMTGLCFLMNFILEKHNNLIYPIVIHFCFNFLYCFLKVDILFYVVLSAVWMVITGICIFLNKKRVINI